MSGATEEALREIARRLKIERPLSFLDLETTGTSPERDRIVEYASVTVLPTGQVTRFRTLVNPGQPIPADASAVHGITDADVANAPAFAEIASELARSLEGHDLGGFNLRRFDLRVLAAEFARAQIRFDPERCRVIDAMAIFHRNEKFGLESAVRFYCERPHQGHRAEADVAATIDVLRAQLARYLALPGDVTTLDEYCRQRSPDALSSDGKIAWRDGAARINFGKHQGKTLQQMAADERGYLEWISRSDFPDDTRKLVLDALAGTFPAEPARAKA